MFDQPNRRVRTRTHGGVTGTAREGLPMSIVSPPPHRERISSAARNDNRSYPCFTTAPPGPSVCKDQPTREGALLPPLPSFGQAQP